MKAIRDLINGNLKDAKKAAKRAPFWRLMQSAQEDYGFSLTKAHAAALYLKGKVSFQAYCDTK